MTHILAVEDSPTQAHALCADLEGAGFAVSLARSGAEALGLLELHEFDLVVSDVVMPGMDGYELCRRVKNDPRSRDVPVVLLTSLTDPLDVVSGLESGADNFIRKPYQAEQLISRLRTAVHNRSIRRVGRLEMGVRLSFLDREFDITAERQQILDLLISTFEELVVTSREVRAREEELARAHAELEQRLHEVALERNRLQAVVDAVPVPMVVVGPDGLVSYVSEAGAHAFQVKSSEMRGRTLEGVVRFSGSDGMPIPFECLPHTKALTDGVPSSAGTAFDVFLEVDGAERVPVVLQASPILDNAARVAGWVGTAHMLGALSQHDSVTGLPNGVAFLDRAVQLLGSPRADSALMILEVDRFDVTRASVGHASANALLVEISARLRTVFESAGQDVTSSTSFLAYLGGTQFGVVLTNLPNLFSVVEFAEAVRRQVADDYVKSVPVRLTASVGVAIGDAAHQGPHLIAAANAALRRACDAGGDRVELFHHEAGKGALDQLQLEIDLRSALDQGQVQLHYQPEVELETGRIIGFEALARWRHDRLGPIPPDVFIEVAEKSGIIIPLGLYLLRLACAQAKTWGEHHEAELTVAVNVSARQLRPEFVEEVVSVLEETGLAPTRLMLEVTETTAMSDPETTGPILAKLRGLGVRFALDDFGTGYSSLAYLTQMPFDQLKLDRGFVTGLQGDGAGAIVAQSIIALGRALAIPVIAEGIEDPLQRQRLRALGCDQGQGYLFSRPLSPEAADEFLGRVRENGYVVDYG